MKLAEERFKNTGTRIFVCPGNDDIFEIDEKFTSSDVVVNCEGKVVQLDGSYEMISTGYSNITPWKCPRDIPDSELGSKVEQMIASVSNLETCIFNLHVPPYDSTLDMAPRLDEKLQPVLQSGAEPEMMPVGSLAVRQAIMRHQPLLGLHGHIHESKGTIKLGRTLCINPGSEYSEGILKGALITVEGNKIINHQLTAG